MSWLPESKDHLPLTWWKGHPVYLSAVLALAAAASMILTAILGPLTDHLVFTWDSLVQLKLWTPVTYILVNPPNLWLVIGCVMFWRFGESVERHLGRRSFVRMLVIMLFVSPLLAGLAALVGAERGCAGVTHLTFAVFIAFATLYPTAQITLILFTVEARLIAAVYVAVAALTYVFARDWISLLILAGQVGTAIAYVRYEQGALTFPSMPSFKASTARPESRSTTSRERDMTPVAKPKKRSPAVDDILDKISREGMQSLTPDERRILDQASEDLQKRKS